MGARKRPARPPLGRSRPILAAPDLVEEQAGQEHGGHADEHEADHEEDGGLTTDRQDDDPRDEQAEERQRMCQEGPGHQSTTYPPCRVSRYAQFGHADGPCCAISLAAIWSCSASG